MRAALLALPLLAACSGGGNVLTNAIFAPLPDPRAEAAAQSGGVPVADTILRVETAPMPGGLILSAVALPPRQGYWDPALVPVRADADGVLVLEFRLLPPLNAATAGPPPSREVLAGVLLTEDDLAGVRRITVQGVGNRVTVRR